MWRENLLDLWCPFFHPNRIPGIGTQTFRHDLAETFPGTLVPAKGEEEERPRYANLLRGLHHAIPAQTQGKRHAVHQRHPALRMELKNTSNTVGG